MKHIPQIFPILIILAAGCGSSRPPGDAATASDARKADSLLLGRMTIEELRAPRFSWFEKNLAEYKPDTNLAPMLPGMLRDVTILCFAGTWCSDTWLQLPRMYRILREAGFRRERFLLWGIDRKKQSPGGEAAEYRVMLSPTFIFLRGGRELGRIEESPKLSLEADMIEILGRP